jgi:capsid protein
MFKSEIINEIARCLNMPLNVATCNSSQYNYASGRLDWQTYFRNITVLRRWFETRFLSRVFRLWYAEGQLIRGYFDGSVDYDGVVWHWPGMEHVDPMKESEAQNTRLKNLSTTYAAEYARQGKDWQIEFEQVAREQETMKRLNIQPQEKQNEPFQTHKEDDDSDEKQDGQSGRHAVFRLR